MQTKTLRDEAIVVEVGFDVAHDTEGLLIVTLRFPNGAISRMQLSNSAIARVVKTLGLESIGGLVGCPFSELAAALQGNSASQERLSQ